MLKLCRIDIEHCDQLFEKIDRYVNRVVERLNPHWVILFGSLATGEINEGSDIDILVVTDFKESFLDRIKTLMDLNEENIPIEPLGYTPEEIDEMKKAAHPFLLEVLSTGKILYQAGSEQP